ncbi:MAG: phenylalanine--tRNA ligase subunit beta [Clostridiales Family XIII bacterium]|jgi:phenylalanyl-tRNA synthetase beta chain|nr:phenylalanine--tRNA ligase subunit beta [Clostridiales Family XIII bacterium]
MLVPLSWMEEYTRGRAPGTENVPERMVLSGSNVETVSVISGDSVENVVVGKVLSVVPHPDSDHLVVCQVQAARADGTGTAAEPIQIVTGAPNVNAGDFIPTALHGSTLPGGVRIKKGKLRGVESAGMLCSAQELGFDDKVVPLACKDGIWVLPDELRSDDLLGADIFEALGMKDAVTIDFEITPNRPDCLSVYGLAREYAAVFDLQLERAQDLTLDADADVKTAGYPEGKAAKDFIKVSIARPDLCARYIARVAEDVVIKESPWWLQKKLMLSGMRPINNIVDITNYVMLELGHPIHAFDISEVTGGEINVDTAAEGERFTTLDGTERTLTADTLLIKDGARGIAVAGVMGGLNSEITEATRTILIEAASFDADSIRRTSKRVGIRTEASSRYEKGVPAELSKVASDRVCQLIRLTGSGTVIAGAADCYPVPQERVTIRVRAARVNAVLGTDLTAEAMADILRRLEMTVTVSEEEHLVLHVTPPYVRLDLVEEIDIIEEVARLYGYDVLATTLHADGVEASVPRGWAIRALSREALCGMGLTEIQTYSFVSPSGVAQILAADDPAKNDFVKILNPLGDENSVMRTTLVPAMLETLARNRNRSAASCFAFEIGNTFRAEKTEEGLPTEALSLCIGLYGPGATFHFLKGALEKLFAKLGISGFVLVQEESSPTFHPGRTALVYAGETLLGTLGEAHPDVLKNFDLPERALIAELDFDKITELAVTDRAYSRLPKYPAALRDVSLLVREDITVAKLDEAIRKGGGKILETVRLFDIYRGMQIPDSFKSMSFGLSFRALDRTLTDEEIQKAMDRILRLLEEEAGASLREV